MTEARHYSTDWYGDHVNGEVILGAGAVRRIAGEIAASMTEDARSSGSEPVVFVTGSRYMPPLRSYPQAERVYQACNGAHSADEFAQAVLWEYLVEELERILAENKVYLGSPDYDNCLYVVDCARFECADDQDEAETLSDEWQPRGN